MKKGFAKGVALACAFVCVGLSGCRPSVPDGEITVYMPDGAPALALAKLMHEDTEDDGVTYRVVDSSLISSKVTNRDAAKNADVCVLPVTAAAKLLGTGETYKMLGTVTHGNLYLLAKEKGAITAENLSTLVGKKVGVLQMTSVPGLTFKATLSSHGIAWQEVTNEGGMVEDKVNLFAISGADAVGVIEADYFMIAEPAASAQSKKGYSIVGNVQTFYGGENGFPQAALVAKTDLLVEHEDWVKSFVERVDGASTWLTETDGATLVATVNAHMDDRTSETSLKAPLLTQTALAGCGIRFTYAAADFEEVNAFLTKLLLVNDKATAMPSENFYWTYFEP